MRSSDRPDSRTVPSIVRCAWSSLLRPSSSSIAITPFIGVRISWLIVARKMLFARFAASASFLARSSACALRLLSEMSAQ